MYQTITNYREKSRLKFVLTLLLLGILPSLLVACSEATINPQPTIITNNGSNSPVATSKPVVITTTVADNNSNVSSKTTSIPQANVTPIIAFSSTVVKIGHTMTISGSGFPFETQLVLLIGPDENQLAGPYAGPVTDAEGRFSVSLTFEPTHINLDPGKYLLKVNVKNDNNTGASSFIMVTADVPTTVTPVAANQKIASLNSPTDRATVGEQIQLDGSGYEPNTTIHIKGGIQNPDKDYGAVQVDDQGNFSKKVNIPNDLTDYTGLYHFITGYPGDKTGFTLKIVTNSNYEPELVTGAVQEIHVGQSLTISGHNFPPNIEVKLRGGVQNLGDDFGTLSTDATGSFTKVITPSGLTGYKGVYYIVADWNALTDVRAAITIS